jgi:hypothetical protein
MEDREKKLVSPCGRKAERSKKKKGAQIYIKAQDSN